MKHQVTHVKEVKHLEKEASEGKTKVPRLKEKGPEENRGAKACIPSARRGADQHRRRGVQIMGARVEDGTNQGGTAR